MAARGLAAAYNLAFSVPINLTLLRAILALLGSSLHAAANVLTHNAANATPTDLPSSR